LSSLKQNNDNKENPLKSYAKYSSIAFKMGAIIFLGVWGGTKIDELTTWETPIFTLIFSIISVAVAIYISIKDFLKQ